MTDHELQQLKKAGQNIRRNIIEMIYQGQAGHPGGSLSCADILAVLYLKILTVDPDNPSWEDRDRFVLSKGHASPALYAALAERGYAAPEELLTFDCIDSCYQGHPDMKKANGVDMSSGSLAQGLSVGIGMALAARLLQKNCRIWVLLGDGELQEGQIWEAAMAAVKYKTGALTAIVDVNDLQLAGTVAEIMPLEPLQAKWEAFGWKVINVDGHDYRQLIEALQEAQKDSDQPVVILAKTIKGKGVSFMEGKVEWHSKAISSLEKEQALSDIGSCCAEGGEQ